jgi:hypothetical protein
MAAAGKAPETSAEKAAGEKRLIDVAMDASLSASVIGLHALETAGKLTLVEFKKAASAVQVAELLKQSKIGLPTGASSALRTLWEAYGAVQRGIKREVTRELEKLMPEGADCEALAAAVFDGNLHALDLQKIVSSKATKTVLGSTSPKSKGAAAKADATDAASESYAHCITGLEFALEILNPNDSSVIATMRLVRAEVTTGAARRGTPPQRPQPGRRGQQAPQRSADRVRPRPRGVPTGAVAASAVNRVGDGPQDEQDLEAYLELGRREHQGDRARGARDGAVGQAEGCGR